MNLFSSLCRHFSVSSFFAATLLILAQPVQAGGDHSGACTGATLLGSSPVGGVHESATDVDHFRVNATGAGVLAIELDSSGPEPRLQFLGRECSGQRGGVIHLEKTDISQTMRVDLAGDYYFAVLTPAVGSYGTYTVRSGFVSEPLVVTEQVNLPLASNASCTDPAAPQVTIDGNNDLVELLDNDPVDNNGSGDQVVVIVIDQFGVVRFEGDTTGVTGSLYTADTCDSKTQLFSDEQLASDGAMVGLDIGTYYLRLHAPVGTTGTSAVELRHMPLPSLGSGSSGS